MSIKNVVVLGATGNLGPSITHALVNASFNVTVLSRSSKHPASLPKQVTIKEVADFTNVADLTTTLRGQDAVVSNIGHTAFGVQTHVIDAAIAAGVKLFLPSEFGSATTNPLTAKLPVFKAKVDTQDYLRQAAEQGKISYALVNNGAFLDWGLETGFVIDTLGQNPTRLYDGGDVPFSATTLADVGNAVVGILQHPQEFKNRAVYVNTAVVTQNQLIAAAKKAAGQHGGSFQTEPVKTTDVYDDAMNVLRTGQGDIGLAMLGFLTKALYDPAYGNKYPQEDTHKLGIKVLTEAEVEHLVKAAVDKKLKASSA